MFWFHKVHSKHIELAIGVFCVGIISTVFNIHPNLCLSGNILSILKACKSLTLGEKNHTAHSGIK